MCVTTQRQVDTGSRRLPEYDRIVREQKFHLVGKRTLQRGWDDPACGSYVLRILSTHHLLHRGSARVCLGAALRISRSPVDAGRRGPLGTTVVADAVIFSVVSFDSQAGKMSN